MHNPLTGHHLADLLNSMTSSCLCCQPQHSSKKSEECMHAVPLSIAGLCYPRPHTLRKICNYRLQEPHFELQGREEGFTLKMMAAKEIMVGMPTMALISPYSKSLNRPPAFAATTSFLLLRGLWHWLALLDPPCPSSKSASAPNRGSSACQTSFHPRRLEFQVSKNGPKSPKTGFSSSLK